jgi:hypothetical protein
MSCYRVPAPDCVAEAAAQRIREIIAEINAVDAAIGEWSCRVPDGTEAPPEAAALLTRREALTIELREAATAYELLRRSAYL